MLGNKEIMAMNLQHYLEKKNMTQSEFADKMGFKRTTVNEWLNAKKYPRIDKIEMMANFFGIRKSDLVELKDEKRNDYIVFDGGKKIDISDLTPDMRKQLEDYVTWLRFEHQKNNKQRNI